jgi:hypothetical protein
MMMIIEDGITSQLAAVLGVLIKIIRDEEPAVHTTVFTVYPHLFY